jgi:large subunit ribosomal protein L9
MEVILRQDVDKLGKRGEVVKVADGYGRNFLLPQGMALLVNDANRAMIAKERRAHEARQAKEKADCQSTCSTARSPRATSPSS